MNVSIVIPNYNGESLLNKNLKKVVEAIQNYNDGKVEIIIADDASSDNSIDVIKDFSKKYKDIDMKLVENTINRGFSSNVNSGVKKAKHEILVLLNTDVSPHVNFLKPLVMHFGEEGIFGVGCLDESMEEGKVVKRGRGVGSFKRGFLVHSAGKLDKTSTLWVAGGSSAFRKKTWDNLGGLNELYNPFYWEDIDISYRARKSGFFTYFEKDSIVRHEHDLGAIKSAYKEKEVKKIAYRNQFIFVWLNADFSTVIFHVAWLPYNFLKTLIKLDFSFYTGFIKAVIILPKIISSRRKIQKSFVLKDKDVKLIS